MESGINSTINGRVTKRSITFYLVCFIFLYALFALNRIKGFWSPHIAGFSSTNEIWLIPLLHVVIVLSQKNIKIKKDSLFLMRYIFMYVIIMTVGGFRSEVLSQYIYAILLFLVPMLLFYSTSKLSHFEVGKLIKLIIITNILYSFFAIILTTNYAFFMNLLGNPIDNIIYYTQYRAPMMLGSSITVSYYFNITLPLIFHFFYNSTELKWKHISILAIILNAVATVLLLSRLSSMVAIIIIVYYVFINRSKTIIRKQKIFLSIGFIVAIVYVLSNYDISRIFMGFDSSGSSVSARFEAVSLGGYIFKKFPFFGSGMGKYYLREYGSKFVTIDGITGLIDPHNMYILILSELGILGLLITMFLFISLIRKFWNIKDKSMKITAIITLVVMLINSMGGSHLVNEISFSTIFWIYMGIFYFFSNKNSTPSIQIGRNFL